jgi:hypothetical protein
MEDYDMNLIVFALEVILLTQNLNLSVTAAVSDEAQQDSSSKGEIGDLAQLTLESVENPEFVKYLIQAHMPILLVPENEEGDIRANYEEIGAIIIMSFPEGSALAELHQSNREGEYFVLTGLAGIRKVLESLRNLLRPRPVRRVIDTAPEFRKLERQYHYSYGDCLNNAFFSVLYELLGDGDPCDLFLNSVARCLGERMNAEYRSQIRRKAFLFGLCPSLS